MKATKRNSIIDVCQWEKTGEAVEKCPWLKKLFEEKRVALDAALFDYMGRPLYNLIIWNFDKNKPQRCASDGDWIIYSDDILQVKSNSEFIKEFSIVE